jgi:hypothetical protein
MGYRKFNYEGLDCIEKGELMLKNRRYRHYQSKYKITQTEYEERFRLQSGMCALCDKPLGDKFVIDHCHKTGKVRGIIHAKCNILLAMADDSLLIIKKAFYYLKGRKFE